MFSNLRKDVAAAKRVGSGGSVRLFLMSQALWAISVYRFGRWTLKVRVPLLGGVLRLTHTILFKLMEIVTGISLPRDAEIGVPLIIAHFGPIIVNQGARLGDGCALLQGVTIGAQFRGKETGIPVLGDNVLVGANAVVIGNVRIGDRVRIGAGAVVTRSIPDDSVVVGNPAEIIKQRGGAVDSDSAPDP